MLSPGVMLDCCHDAAWIGGITPGLPRVGFTIRRVTFRHVARIWPRGGWGPKGDFRGGPIVDLRGPNVTPSKTKDHRIWLVIFF